MRTLVVKATTTSAYIQAHIWETEFGEELGVGVNVVEDVFVCHSACFGDLSTVDLGAATEEIVVHHLQVSWHISSSSWHGDRRYCCCWDCGSATSSDVSMLKIWKESRW